MLVQSQENKQRTIFIMPSNSLQKRYADSAFEGAIRSTDVYECKKTKQILSEVETRNLKEQHRLWFDILIRTFGNNQDNELIKQNKLLQNVSVQEPLSSEKAIEYAKKLAENGYTPENTSNLFQKRGINVVKQLLQPEFPLNIVLFSPIIILGKIVDSHDDTKANEFTTVVSIISTESVLKGDTTIKKFSIKEMIAIDGPPALETNDKHIFFLEEPLQSSNKKNTLPSLTRIADLPLTSIRGGRKYSTVKEGIEKTNAYCKELHNFFQSLVLTK
jgi:hypothetical protein